MRYLLALLLIGNCLAAEEFLLTFPKSGTNLLIASLQYTNKKPCAYYARPTDFENPGVNRLQLPLDFSLPTIYRTHRALHLHHLNNGDNTLLMVLRNPMEAILRLLKDSNIYHEKDILEAFFTKHPFVEHYFNNLLLFHRWDNNKKLLVYYEDLVVNPKHEIKRVQQFLKMEEVEIPLREYQAFKEKLLWSYAKQFPVTQQSKGLTSTKTGLCFHSSYLSEAALCAIERYLKELHPKLYIRYLKRYEL